MRTASASKHQWAVILAGGEGVRLRPLTRLVSGEDIPKQFCPLLNGRTLQADAAADGKEDLRGRNSDCGVEFA